ncbi:MAG TPA: hypothetical protein DD435_14880 [Cyanobacteria bacterium UBA8530]|nr:hypothetical protein [Cyanobacteria bacterium UBA8530]
MTQIGKGPVSAPPIQPQTPTETYQKSTLGKVVQGWETTIGDIPTAVKDTLVKTAHNVLHPIEYVREEIDTIKKNPLAFIKRLAIKAGTIGIAFLSPPLGAMLGAAMTAAMFVTPTYQFAVAKSESEIRTTAHGTAQQLVSYAANYAVGKASRFVIDAVKARGSASIGETHARKLKEPLIRNKELNVENYKRFRGVAQEIQQEVRKQYGEVLAKNNLSPADIELALNQKDMRLKINEETFNILEGMALKQMGGFDSQTVQSLALPDMRTIRRYTGKLGSAYDLMDANKAITRGVKKNVLDGKSLTLKAEEALALQRGLGKDDFAALTEAGLGADEIQSVRSFADRAATAEGGKYFLLASKEVDRLKTVPALKRAMTGEMMKDMGFRNFEELDTRSMLMLMQDTRMEEISSVEAYVKNANQLLAKGVRDYATIDRTFEKGLLGKLGVSNETLDKMQANGWENKPDTAIEQYRGVRDVLRVLPEDARSGAIDLLDKGPAPEAFAENLTQFLDEKISSSFEEKGIAESFLATFKGDVEKANFLSSYARLPAEVKKSIFTGLDETGALDKQIVDRFQGVIEERFKVKMNRQAGAIADRQDPNVVDWDPHGSLQLFNGLEKMSVKGQLPEKLEGTTYFRTSGEYGTFGYQFSKSGKDYVTIGDFALAAPNRDEGIGLPSGEGTIVHESGHAMQLGGPHLDWSAKREDKLDAEVMKNWSRLSDWRETNRSLADGKTRDQSGKFVSYYKDPATQVGNRGLVASDYGATDPAEDFAEFARYFYSEPVAAMKLSPEKYLFLNDFAGGKFSPQQVMAHSEMAGLGSGTVQKAVDGLRSKFEKFGLPNEGSYKMN